MINIKDTFFAAVKVDGTLLTSYSGNRNGVYRKRGPAQSLITSDVRVAERHLKHFTQSPYNDPQQRAVLETALQAAKDVKVIELKLVPIEEMKNVSANVP